MKEIWDLAISPGVLPFSLLLIPVALYWLLCLVGLLDLDAVKLDFDSPDGLMDADPADVAGGEKATGKSDGQQGSLMKGVMDFFHATDVPVLLVLSIMVVQLWMFAMLGNLILPIFGASLVAVGAMILAAVGTKVVAKSLQPIFHKFKETEEDPVIGKVAKVRTLNLDDKSGQIALEHRGTTNYLNARLSAGQSAVARHEEVIIFDYDHERGQYLVKPLNHESNHPIT